MKTTLDLPDEKLAEACALSGLKTKRSVVMAALDEFIKSRRRQQLIDILGTVDLSITPDEIQAGRETSPDKAAALERWRQDAGVRS